MKLKNLYDLLWLVLLGLFVFAGMAITTYHGDESYHIYTSNDYATVFIQHHPEDLMVHSLWESDQGYQRLLNGELTRYIIGFGWQLAGLTQEKLPGHGYYFGEGYDDNVNGGLVPPPELLTIFRTPVTFCFVLSVGVIFLLGKLYGGRPLAYFVSLLYAINPVTLINGRRALQESPLLLFGLLTVYVALVIAQKREQGLPVRTRWWIGLILTGTLTFAAKQSGFVYVVPAYLAIFVPELLRFKRSILGLTGRLILCTLATVLLFFVITPGIWYDPIARINDMIGGRHDVMQTQIDLDPNAPMTQEEQILALIRQPFMTAPQQYELEPVKYSVAQDDQIYEYMRSPLSGLQFGTILGGALTLLAFWGLIVNAIPSLRLNRSWALALGLYFCIAANIYILMNLLLPWQRYYLSEIPFVTLASGIGLFSLIRLFRERRSREPVQVPQLQNA